MDATCTATFLSFRRLLGAAQRAAHRFAPTCFVIQLEDAGYTIWAHSSGAVFVRMRPSTFEYNPKKFLELIDHVRSSHAVWRCGEQSVTWARDSGTPPCAFKDGSSTITILMEAWRRDFPASVSHTKVKLEDMLGRSFGFPCQDLAARFLASAAGIVLVPETVEVITLDASRLEVAWLDNSRFTQRPVRYDDGTLLFFRRFDSIPTTFDAVVHALRSCEP